MPASVELDLDNCRPPQESRTARLTVAQLARATGPTADTVRDYERAGLLPPPDHTPAAHRRYHDTGVDRLHSSRVGSALGLRLRLREIKTLLESGTAASTRASRRKAGRPAHPQRRPGARAPHRAAP